VVQKKENNSTSVTVNNQLKIIDFSDFWEVPQLMERWLRMLNEEIQIPKEPPEILKSYARLHVSFAAIHPFGDGNGRIARLVANLPGHPPIIIEKERRSPIPLKLCCQRLDGFAEVCGMSLRIGMYEPGALRADRDALIMAVRPPGTDAGIIWKKDLNWNEH
jgi:hypothetical protein